MPNKPNRTAPVRPAWLTEDCPTWCVWSDWHANRDMYDDRTHAGEGAQIVLTTEEPMTHEKPGGGIEVFDDPEFVSVYLLQHYREAEPRIWVGKSETSEGVHLSIAEAEQLITELRARVDAAAKR